MAAITKLLIKASPLAHACPSHDLDRTTSRANLSRPVSARQKATLRSTLFAVFPAILLVGCGEQDAEQPVKVKSGSDNVVLVVPRGYFLVPPPKDGLYTRASEEAFMVDFPAFDYKSTKNLQTFLEVGSPNVVLFSIRFAESKSIDDLLAYKLSWYGKETEPRKDTVTGLLTFETKVETTSPFKKHDVFFAGSPEKILLDCSPLHNGQSPRCGMNFNWQGHLITADFSRKHLSEWSEVKRKTEAKLNCWHKDTKITGACNAK
ncbi:hypothetical protein I6F11_29840 [Ensifer sp. NBAIM29]|nr:hypothetical protein [Ensifer sp. NBAIM29]